jgi:TetR/AcrR family transcriptional repressor of nem operon
MRSSRQDTEKHREAIIDAAARLVREKGFDSVSIPDLMAKVGMTHGGFYRHFASKEELAPLAFARAFSAVDNLLVAAAKNHPGDTQGALQEFFDTYLSPAHRDEPGTGCAGTALVGDMARTQPGAPAQRAYVCGVEHMLRELQDAQGSGAAGSHQQALVTLSTIVGALLLSRATRGNTISDELLTAALEAVSPKPD